MGPGPAADDLARRALPLAGAVARAECRRAGAPWLADEAASVAAFELARALRGADPAGPGDPARYLAWCVGRNVRLWLRLELRRPDPAPGGPRAPEDPARPGRAWGATPDYLAHAARLGPGERALVDLVCLRGLSVNAAADALGLARSAALARWHRALARMRGRSFYRHGSGKGGGAGKSVKGARH